MHRLSVAALALVVLVLFGCAATTSVRLTPAPQRPVCDGSANVAVLWATRWRADQKDVSAREAAAAQGIARFFDESGCFKSIALRRVTSPAEGVVGDGAGGQGKLLFITVRELGPVLRIGSAAGLVEGGTEVVLDVAEHAAPATQATRQFTVHWQNGGAGVIKGVGSLPRDMEAALAAGLQPAPR